MFYIKIYTKTEKKTTYCSGMNWSGYKLIRCWYELYWPKWKEEIKKVKSATYEILLSDRQFLHHLFYEGPEQKIHASGFDFLMVLLQRFLRYLIFDHPCGLTQVNKNSKYIDLLDKRGQWIKIEHAKVMRGVLSANYSVTKKLTNFGGAVCHMFLFF